MEFAKWKPFTGSKCRKLPTRKKQRGKIALLLCLFAGVAFGFPVKADCEYKFKNDIEKYEDCIKRRCVFVSLTYDSCEEYYNKKHKEKRDEICEMVLAECVEEAKVCTEAFKKNLKNSSGECGVACQKPCVNDIPD